MSSYGSGAGYALGQVVEATATQGSFVQTTANTYAWYDGAAVSGVAVTGTGQAAAGSTVLEFDAFGLVTAKTITGGSNGSFGYSYDAASQGVTVTQTLGGQSYADRWKWIGPCNPANTAALVPLPEDGDWCWD